MKVDLNYVNMLHLRDAMQDEVRGFLKAARYASSCKDLRVMGVHITSYQSVVERMSSLAVIDHAIRNYTLMG